MFYDNHSEARSLIGVPVDHRWQTITSTPPVTLLVLS